MHILNGEMFRAEEARIHGHLFENPRMGIPRGIYWALFVQFEPVSLDSEEWPSSLGCEWIEWPIRRWEELDGREVTVTKTSEGTEASLYLFNQHQQLKSLQASLTYTRDNRFRIDFDATLDAMDANGDVVPNLAVGGQTEAEFQGIIIVPGNSWPKPDTPDAAIELLAPFVDLSAYEEPRFDRFRWIVAPRMADNSGQDLTDLG